MAPERPEANAIAENVPERLLLPGPHERGPEPQWHEWDIGQLCLGQFPSALRPSKFSDIIFYEV